MGCAPARSLARSAVALLALAATLAAACTTGEGRSGSGDRAATVEVNGLQLTEAEMHYGLAPAPHPDVTYAPDVVLVGGGADSVRSVTADGMTWTIDGDAPRADELEVGKVMFLTGRGVGRVHALEAQGRDLVVTIGPVDLTDVIYEGEFTVEDQPIRIEDMLVYDSGEVPWSVAELPPADDEAAPDAETAGGPAGIRALRSSSGAQPEPPPQPQPPTDVRRLSSKPPTRGEPGIVSVGSYDLRPLCCGNGGPGVRVQHNGPGAYLLATVRVFLEEPRASWKLVIGAGTVRHAEFAIHGSGGFGYQFEAVLNERGGNLNDRIAVPTTFSIPFQVGNVPFSLVVSQSLLVQTALSSPGSAIGATGRWNLSGAVGFRYDGAFRQLTPSGFSTRSSMLHQMKGIALDPAGIVLGHSLRVTVGIGWDAFHVGPYAELVTTLGAVRGSAAASPLVYCRGVTVTGAVGAGIGYSLPKVVVEVVNFILRLVGASTIQATGELAGLRYPFLNETATDPPNTVCQY